MIIIDIKINWNNYCYDPEKHNCTGECQGASDCPLVEYYRSRMYEVDIKKPTKDIMINYFKKQKEMSIKWEFFLKSKEGKNFIEELKKELR